MLEERIVDHNTFQISSHVTEWRCNEEPKWHVRPVLFTMIQSEHVILWLRQGRKPLIHNTLLQNIRRRRSRSFENSWSNLRKIMQCWRGNLLEIKIPFQYLKNISILRFHEQFLRNGWKLGYLQLPEKISNSYDVDVLYIILNHLTWRFAIYHSFGSNAGTFRNFWRKIYTLTIDHAIKNSPKQIHLNEKRNGQRWRPTWKQQESKNYEGKFTFCWSIITKIIMSINVYNLQEEGIIVS